MKSILGPSQASTEKGTPYLLYSWGVQEEGQRQNAMFSSDVLAMNALMQTIIDLVLENQDKNIIWRVPPSVESYLYIDPVSNETSTLWKARARFAFE